MQPQNLISVHPFFQGLRSSQIPSLSGLRGIAAVLVVLGHSVLSGGYGTLAVNLFFVLSGFLITHLLLKEYEQYQHVSLTRFYIRRSLRIFPAFYASWFFTLAVGLAIGAHFHWLEAAASFLYLGDEYHAFRRILPTAPHRIFIVTWTLGVEEKFYLLWPALFVFVKGSWGRLARICCVIMLGVWALRAVLIYVVQVPATYHQHAFEMHIDTILMGCFLALLTRLPAGISLIEKIAPSKWWVPGTLLLLCAIHWLCLSTEAMYYSIGFPLESILLGVLLIQLIAFGNETGLRWLNSGPMLLLGNLSYGIYLYHYPIRLACTYYMKDVRMRYQAPVMILAPIVVAVISYYCVERPFLRLKLKYSAGAGSTAEHRETLLA